MQNNVPITIIMKFVKIKTLPLLCIFIFVSAPRIYAANSCQNIPKDNCELSKNVIDFVGNNFKRFLDHVSIVSFDINDRLVHRTIYHLLVLSWKKDSKLNKTSLYMTVKFLGEQGNITQTINITNRNIIAIASSTNTSRWKNYLNLMTKTKANSVILVFTGYLDNTKVRTLHEMMNDISKNSMFFTTYRSKETLLYFTWNQMITLDGYENSIINQIEFDSSGRIIENYDMQGIHLFSVSLTWSPYFIITNCTDEHSNCQSEGYLAETMDILGGMMNFTWESHREKDNNWGTKPISGPANSSGIWGGVEGNVFNGTYQISIR